MALVHVQCPYCQSTGAVKYGKQTNGTQRYRCDNADRANLATASYMLVGNEAGSPGAWERSHTARLLPLSR